eukprot:s1575_g4.t1
MALAGILLGLSAFGTVSSLILDPQKDAELLADLKTLIGSEVNLTKGENAEIPDDKLWNDFKEVNGGDLRTNRSRTDAREIHVDVMDWLSRNHPHHPRRRELMERVSQRLYQLGLTPSPHQWTERLNEQLTPFVLIDPETQEVPWPGPASALSWLEGNFSDVILPAFAAANDAGAWEEHDEGLHNAGHWELAWIWQDDKCDAKWHPKVCDLVQDIQDIWPAREALLSARFSRMNPNTKVMDHTAATNQRIKIHCGVYNPSNVTMFIADQELTWRRGHCVLLDDSYGHRLATAATDEPRTILEIKIYHPDLAWADCLDDDGALDDDCPHQVKARSSQNHAEL